MGGATGIFLIWIGSTKVRASTPRDVKLSLLVYSNVLLHGVQYVNQFSPQAIIPLSSKLSARGHCLRVEDSKLLAVIACIIQ